MNDYQKKIETLLLYQNQPASYQWISRHLGISIGTVRDEVIDMIQYYKDRGIALVVTEDEVALVTAPDQHAVIDKLLQEEDAKELSKQSLETLAIILYKEKGITKPEIDFIRGVNSTYILRNLMVRGLIDKKTNGDDRRSPYYIPTLELLSHLGVTQIQELDLYEDNLKKLEDLQIRFVNNLKETENQE